jgi:rhomboid family GlyGly-CTERM serine protease
VPAGIACLAALAELFGEPGRLWLRYERAGLGTGEVWRLVTGHVVHLGPSHMLMNIVALAVLALVFVRFMKPLDWLRVFVISALAIDVGLYWFSPGVDWYVGLSGVLHGFWAAASVCAWQQDRRQAVVMIVLLMLKFGFEAWYGPVPMTGAVAAGPVVTVAHAYGAIGGGLWALIALAIRPRKRSL